MMRGYLHSQKVQYENALGTEYNILVGVTVAVPLLR